MAIRGPRLAPEQVVLPDDAGPIAYGVIAPIQSPGLGRAFGIRIPGGVASALNFFCNGVQYAGTVRRAAEDAARHAYGTH